MHKIKYELYGDDYMFFVAGVSSKQKKLDFNQTVICSNCGKYGRYEVIMEYMYLSLFFIPTLKWNKKFYVTSSCCGSIYSLDKELGERIAKGENVTLNQMDMQVIHCGDSYAAKQCTNCGYETDENFQYCPKCGSLLRK
jgi:hypothetical protein